MKRTVKYMAVILGIIIIAAAALHTNAVIGIAESNIEKDAYCFCL